MIWLVCGIHNTFLRGNMWRGVKYVTPGPTTWLQPPLLHAIQMVYQCK